MYRYEIVVEIQDPRLFVKTVASLYAELLPLMGECKVFVPLDQATSIRTIQVDRLDNALLFIEGLQYMSGVRSVRKGHGWTCQPNPPRFHVPLLHKLQEESHARQRALEYRRVMSETALHDTRIYGIECAEADSVNLDKLECWLEIIGPCQVELLKVEWEPDGDHWDFHRYVKEASSGNDGLDTLRAMCEVDPQLYAEEFESLPFSQERRWVNGKRFCCLRLEYHDEDLSRNTEWELFIREL